MKEPFVAWPGWAHLRYTALLSALNGGWFVLVYGGCDWITAHRALRVHLELPCENSWPFLPGAVVFYMSIYPLFLLGPFVVRTRREFTALVSALAFSTLCGGVGFLCLPSQPFYPPPGPLGIWKTFYRWADGLNLTYNMAPSLHVALSVCCVAGYSRYVARAGRWLCWGWAGAIALSTLFLHQHYLADVVSGWLLGISAERLSRRWCGRLPDGGTARALFPRPAETIRAKNEI